MPYCLFVGIMKARDEVDGDTGFDYDSKAVAVWNVSQESHIDEGVGEESPEEFINTWEWRQHVQGNPHLVG